MAGENGVYEATVLLMEEHQASNTRESILVLEHGIQLLDNLSDGCQVQSHYYQKLTPI